MPRSMTTRNTFRPQVEAFEERLALSTLDISGGNLRYEAAAGASNNLTVIHGANGGYVFVDRGEVINLTGNTTGTTGSGTTVVTIPAASVTGSIRVFLGDGHDKMRVDSTAKPLTTNMGSGNDVFEVGVGAITGSVTVNGAAGRDWLDYSLWTTGVMATVNRSGNALAWMIGMENIRGGAGGDTLYGDNSANILVGLGGSDLLYGYGERDFLIGGFGGDGLFGGNGDDLLVIGSISSTFGLNNLEAIQSEWRRLDLSYADRKLHISNGGGVNGAFILNSATVSSDAVIEFIVDGSDGANWYFM